MNPHFSLTSAARASATSVLALYCVAQSTKTLPRPAGAGLPAANRPISLVPLARPASTEPEPESQMVYPETETDTDTTDTGNLVLPDTATTDTGNLVYPETATDTETEGNWIGECPEIGYC